MLPRFLPKRMDTPAGEILLREVQRKDLKALNRIINEPEVNRFVLVPAPVPMKSTVEHYRENKKAGKVFVACIFRNEVMGSILLIRHSLRVSHVGGLGIAFSKEAHGRGIALAALRHCFAWLKKLGVEKVVTEVVADNLRARAFYRKAGFKELCILKKNYRRGNRYVGIIMIEKFL